MYFLDPGHIPQCFPKRIISLVPSQTELLYDLGLEEETIGITKFCIHPGAWFRNKTRIGGTKTIDIEKIKALQPDLIIANKEENVKEQIEALGHIAPVWVSDIHTLGDAIAMIREVGNITGRTKRAVDISGTIEQGFAGLKPAKALSALYLIWRNPWMTVGRDTFIHDIMQRTGLKNVYENRERYPKLDPEDIKARRPEVVLLSSEPYPFKEKHIAELQLLLPEARIILADGEMFSWYGSRLLQAPAYLRQLINILQHDQK